jgi:hypothetical protein
MEMRKILAVVAMAAALTGVVASSAQAQARWYGGHRWCAYDTGWHGGGWYWCGANWRRGAGWGGGYGWRGWGGNRGWHSGVSIGIRLP